MLSTCHWDLRDKGPGAQPPMFCCHSSHAPSGVWVSTLRILSHQMLGVKAFRHNSITSKIRPSQKFTNNALNCIGMSSHQTWMLSKLATPVPKQCAAVNTQRSSRSVLQSWAMGPLWSGKDNWTDLKQRSLCSLEYLTSVESCMLHIPQDYRICTRAKER